MQDALVEAESRRWLVADLKILLENTVLSTADFQKQLSLFSG